MLADLKRMCDEVGNGFHIEAKHVPPHYGSEFRIEMITTRHGVSAMQYYTVRSEDQLNPEICRMAISSCIHHWYKHPLAMKDED